MRRWNVVIAAVGAAALIGLFVVEDEGAGRFIGFWVIVGAVTGLYTLNFLWPRRPRLRVEYRNTVTQRPEVWQGDPQVNLRVFVVNGEGGGAAEAVEVRFQSFGNVYNESGNPPDPDRLDIRVHPPLFLGRDRVLEPGDEWPIALMGQMHGLSSAPRLHWEARARGMAKREGTVELRMVDPPPA